MDEGAVVGGVGALEVASARVDERSRRARGLAEAEGVEADVDFVVGTFSKSLGAIGGFATSHHPQLDMIRYASRPYIFTASSSPATIASVRTAMGTVRWLVVC